MKVFLQNITIIARKVPSVLYNTAHILLADAPGVRFFQLAILCGGLAGTLILHHIFSVLDLQKEQTTFNEDVTNRLDAIRNEVKNLSESLLSLGRSVQLLPALNHAQFRFIADPIGQRLDSVTIIGWVPRVPRDQKEAFEEKAKKELFSGFAIRPIPGYQTDKNVDLKYYYPILYTVPYANQTRIGGYDESSVPVLSSAIEAASLSQLLVVSDPFIFPLFSDTPLAAWVYPVKFSTDKSPSENNVAGYVQFIMDIGRLVDVAIRKVVKKNIDVIVSTASNESEGQVLYQYHAQAPKRGISSEDRGEGMSGLKKAMYTLYVGQNAWKVQFVALPNYYEYSYLPYFIIIGGTIITLFLVIFLKFIFHIEQQYHIQEELERQVKERTDELKKTFAQLEITQKQMLAQEKLASLGTVASGLAHEVQNPLNFILNFSELSVDLIAEIGQFFRMGLENINKKEAANLQDDLTDLGDNIKKIQLHGKRIDSIVHKIQEYGKQTTKEFSEVNIPLLIKETLEITQRQIATLHKGFEVKITKELDPAIQSAEMIPTDIAQVLMHLFNNAFQAMLEKRIKIGETFKPELTVKVTRTGNNLFSIAIRDNGMGISEANAKKIFTPLFTTKPTGEGTGLGLSTSYSIVTDEHHGKMSFKSQENEFTEFLFELPIK